MDAKWCSSFLKRCFFADLLPAHSGLILPGRRRWAAGRRKSEAAMLTALRLWWQ
jgi:hypothetical protein